MKISARSIPISNTAKFSIESSPHRRLQPTLPTGSQGEEGTSASGIGVSPRLVGRLGASGELESPRKMSESHSTAMVRVPGAFGTSGFRRESHDEVVQTKTVHEVEASAE